MLRSNSQSLGNPCGQFLRRQEAQLSPSYRAMRLVSSNLANCHATVQKLLIGPTTSPDQTDGMKLEV